MDNSRVNINFFTQKHVIRSIWNVLGTRNIYFSLIMKQPNNDTINLQNPKSNLRKKKKTIYNTKSCTHLQYNCLL